MRFSLCFSMCCLKIWWRLFCFWKDSLWMNWIFLMNPNRNLVHLDQEVHQKSSKSILWGSLFFEERERQFHESKISKWFYLRVVSKIIHSKHQLRVKLSETWKTRTRFQVDCKLGCWVLFNFCFVPIRSNSSRTWYKAPLWPWWYWSVSHRPHPSPP